MTVNNPEPPADVVVVLDDPKRIIEAQISPDGTRIDLTGYDGNGHLVATGHIPLGPPQTEPN